MVWPAYSPDLSPVKLHCDEIEIVVRLGYVLEFTGPLELMHNGHFQNTQNLNKTA